MRTQISPADLVHLQEQPARVDLETIMDSWYRRSVRPHAQKSRNYELAEPTCPRNADSVHRNRAIIPTDCIYLPRECDCKKPDVIGRDWLPYTCGLDGLWSLSDGAVRPLHCTTRPKPFCTMVKSKVLEALLYECATWTPLKGVTTRRSVPKTLRIRGAWCRSQDHLMKQGRVS